LSLKYKIGKEKEKQKEKQKEKEWLLYSNTLSLSPLSFSAVPRTSLSSNFSIDDFKNVLDFQF
jgi:hypothetical protein